MDVGLILVPSTEDEWLEIAKDFENQWPSLEGKHLQIQCPGNSGSSFYNYKGTKTDSSEARYYRGTSFNLHLHA
ncbi:unnamed protein product [Acanthoscelides obtectus]|uniref:Uncharacterized protein n=1 Tax=Acanthoscelides obtectus TaxID=200917 RepID=A0A9P0K8Z9_ACAOB|nr:unnamed protein product [Acanthoscelides obtectus]CAK1662348.1 hypothetical protein AOBTE_LOCUS23099 [Acanthoscelides obtectus]